MSDDEYRCPSCSIPMVQHMGIYGICAENQKLKADVIRRKQGPTATIPYPLLEAYIALTQAVLDHREHTPPIVVMAAKRCQE